MHSRNLEAKAVVHSSRLKNIDIIKRLSDFEAFIQIEIHGTDGRTSAMLARPRKLDDSGDYSVCAKRSRA